MANGKKKSKRAIYILSAFALLVVIVVVLVAATRGSTKIDPSKLAKVERGDLAKSVVATGKIEPITKVEVKSKASGIVQKLLVDYGEGVKKNQVLAELDKEEILAQVNQQKASLQASEAAARAAEAGTKASEAVNSSTEVKTTAATLNSTVSDLKASNEVLKTTVAKEQAQAQKAAEEGPSTIKYKGINITPGGFLDAAGVFRSRWST